MQRIRLVDALKSNKETDYHALAPNSKTKRQLQETQGDFVSLTGNKFWRVLVTIKVFNVKHPYAFITCNDTSEDIFLPRRANLTP